MCIRRMYALKKIKMQQVQYDGHHPDMWIGKRNRHFCGGAA